MFKKSDNYFTYSYEDDPTNNAVDEDSVVVDAEVIDEDPAAIPSASVDPKKAKGAKQMVAGAAVTAAGVPMLILPGPGIAAIAGGVALMGAGYQNMTGKEVIDEETKNDPSYKQGEEWGREWGQRVKDYAAEDLAPAAKEMAAEAKEAAAAAGKGVKAVANTGAEVAEKGFRAVVGDDAADKAEDFVDEKLAPVGRGVAKLGRAAFGAVKPLASKAAEKGSEAAASAGEKLAQQAKELLK
ncbi:MAG: PGPGW domain-containing protein [Coriobacteriales bacterium]